MTIISKKYDSLSVPLRKRIAFYSIIYGSVAVIFISIDFVLSLFHWFGLINGPLMIGNPEYHHGFIAKSCVVALEGETICTNSLGFRDREIRTVTSTSDKPRLLVIGDSFTMGFGLDFDQTFVARLQKDHPEIEILNAAVNSYAPSAYLAKIKWFFESGYHADHVLVMMDISDIQDEATAYYTDEHTGHLMMRDQGALLAGFPTGFNDYKPMIADRLMLTATISKDVQRVMYIAKNFIKDLIGYSGAEKAKSITRGAWSYEPPDMLAHDYAPLGVAGGINQARDRMDKLYNFLKLRGIPLSVGVYPWPGQLEHDSVDSKAVTIWRDWCLNKCKTFINAFPEFFSYRNAHPETWYTDLFIKNDVHFNALGDQIVQTTINQQLNTMLQDHIR